MFTKLTYIHAGSLHMLSKTGINPNVQQQSELKAKMWYIHTIEYYSVVKGSADAKSYNVDELKNIALSAERKEAAGAQGRSP